ncbi:MAG: hypothetical protein DRP15_03740 [Candidatus Aenigmatarchaeota archaeon]|nr:MAG: hypothetical protein DRP15_03740 [Candidatus Aenigmarchaeota archaeon]
MIKDVRMIVILIEDLCVTMAILTPVMIRIMMAVWTGWRRCVLMVARMGFAIIQAPPLQHTQLALQHIPQLLLLQPPPLTQLLQL